MKEIIVRKPNRILVQGITGRQGTFWTERMIEYGAKVVGGVNPKRAGETFLDVPIFASAVEAAKEDEIDVAVMFIPPLAAREAALDAIAAKVKLLVVLTEHIPTQDVMYFMAAARDSATRIIGPNTAGLVTPGETFVGIMPAWEPEICRPGRIAVVSRSGSLGTLMCLNLVQAGYGQSAVIGLGGDPILGTTASEALQVLEADPNTDAIVLVGEIGGTGEEDAAEVAAGMTKPIVAYIAGGASPPGRKMGHAGAIVMGNKGTYASKRSALESAGATVLDMPSQLADALADKLGKRGR
jgi:succinyl-CoA synthetase alpha subunit